GRSPRGGAARVPQRPAQRRPNGTAPGGRRLDDARAPRPHRGRRRSPRGPRTVGRRLRQRPVQRTAPPPRRPGGAAGPLPGRPPPGAPRQCDLPAGSLSAVSRRPLALVLTLTAALAVVVVLALGGSGGPSTSDSGDPSSRNAGRDGTLALYEWLGDLGLDVH